MLVSKKLYYQIFLFSFVLFYFCFTWFPQYTAKKFEPANFSMPLDGLGMDLYSDFVSAKLMAEHKSARLVDINNPKADYPYPIGNVIHNYGALAIVGIAPFQNLDFQYIRIFWFLLSIAIIFFLINKGHRSLISEGEFYKFSYWLSAIFIMFLYVIMSGPLNLMLERGQLEVLVPFFLYFVWMGYRAEENPAITAVMLGLAIHLKIWPVILLGLFLKRSKLKVCILAALVSLMPDLLLNPILPVRDHFLSVKQYSSAASEMVGWANISLHSFLVSVAHWQVSWKWVSVLWFGVSGLLVLFLNQTLPTNNRQGRDLLFVFCITTSLLTPGFICDYCLVIVLLLLPMLSSVKGNLLFSILLSVLFSNLLFFGVYAGAIKAVVLFILTMSTLSILIYQVLNQQKTSTEYNDLVLVSNN